MISSVSLPLTESGDYTVTPYTSKKGFVLTENSVSEEGKLLARKFHWISVKNPTKSSALKLEGTIDHSSNLFEANGQLYFFDEKGTLEKFIVNEKKESAHIESTGVTIPQMKNESIVLESPSQRNDNSLYVLLTGEKSQLVCIDLEQMKVEKETKLENAQLPEDEVASSFLVVD